VENMTEYLDRWGESTLAAHAMVWQVRTPTTG
jgi:hypothetical protein